MLQRLLAGVLTTLALAVLVTAVTHASDGRWKVDGNGGCYWDANDSGPDQCEATLGRWKVDGNGGCYWDATDSGPDQCAPQATAESEVASSEDAVSQSREDTAGTKQDREIPAQR
jgi:hypothetical protein